MPSLIRVGDVWVNLDRVDSIRVHPAGSEVWYAPPIDKKHYAERDDEIISGDWTLKVPVIEATFGTGDNEYGQPYQRFWANEAEALIRWLDANTTNVTPNTEMDEEWEAYKEKGGTMGRSTFEAEIESLRDENRRMDLIDPDLEPALWKSLMDSSAKREKRLLY